MLVLGIDGMDPVLLRDLMESGRMPAFSALAADGAFVPLETSAPPQSPVAWSNFIAGASPGTHQIFDFIHRDPDPPGAAQVLPYLSTSRVAPPGRDWAITVGGWRLPLFGGRTVSLRRGEAFWDHLLAAGVETSVWRVPANYPPPTIEGSAPFRCLCGMGTPDLLGTYGEFTLLTPAAPPEGRIVSGGRFARLEWRDHRGTGVITGPPNYLKAVGPGEIAEPLTVAVTVVRDPDEDVALVTVGDRTLMLNRAEWSDWIPVRLETGIPGSAVLAAAQLPTSLPAMVRFYLREVHPTLQLYASPLNIDPQTPVNAVGTPGDFSAEVAEACGRYYTTGIPEDTAALRALTEDEFLSQVEILKQERFRQYRWALERFDRGFMFFYFGHTDLLSHIFWRDRDPGHPAHDADEARRYATVITDMYVEMDGILGEALDRLGDDDTIIVMSDHGFTSFRRGFNLNTWLREQGYLVLDPAAGGNVSYLVGVDWSRTRAYGLGLNALYLNQAGREKSGIVTPAEAPGLLREISEKLLAVRDADGTPVIQRMYAVEETYPGADPAVAPDLLVGYADTFRASWATAAGGLAADVLEDNHDRWSGDHCIAHEVVPGILVTNRPLAVSDPALIDLAPTILDVFGIPRPSGMTGRPVLAD